MKSGNNTDEKRKKYALVMDIEGTVSPIDFVKNVLFPYSILHIQDYLRKFVHFQGDGSPELLSDLLKLSDAEAKTDPTVIKPRMECMADDLSRNCIAWIKADKKFTALKDIQGRMWKAGYASGSFRAELFEDVAPALQLLKDSYELYVYSSGSETAQRLFMENTTSGDISHLFSGFYDTKVGPKKEKASYERIAKLMERSAGRITYITDCFAEASAAREAGLKAKLVLRPGNAPLPVGAASFDIIKSVWEIKPHHHHHSSSSSKFDRHVFIDSDGSN